MKRDDDRARFFSELWDASTDAFWVCEPGPGDDFLLLSFNPAQKAILPEAAEGRRFSDMIGSNYEEATSGYRECLRTRALVEFDQHYPIGGRQRWFRTTLVPILDAEGRVSRIWGTSRDLSDLIDARRQAEDSARELERMVGERTAMLEAVIAELAKANRELSEANARYQDLALKDPLTGLANRRCFEESGERELIRSRRYGRQLSLALFDMDDLKRLNDEFGHPQGDLAIKRLATALAAASRSTDIAARLGGDEFALILPETGSGEAALMAARVLESLGAGVPGEPELPYSVSASAGAVCACEGDASFSDLYARADRALYRAKNGGKGTVVAE